MTDKLPTIDEKIACIKRELNMRRRAYPKWISSGRLTQKEANQQILLMENILADLEMQKRISFQMLQQMKALLDSRDYETAHSEADKILTTIARTFGCAEVVAEYDKITKHFA